MMRAADDRQKKEIEQEQEKWKEKGEKKERGRLKGVLRSETAQKNVFWKKDKKSWSNWGQKETWTLKVALRPSGVSLVLMFRRCAVSFAAFPLSPIQEWTATARRRVVVGDMYRYREWYEQAGTRFSILESFRQCVWFSVVCGGGRRSTLTHAWQMLHREQAN